MKFVDLSINGAWVSELQVHSDSRGIFFEWFKHESFNYRTEKEFKLAQANCSISQRGVLRGIHYTKNAPGQSKLVTVFSGSVLDVIVDLRVGSQTFGQWDSIILNASEPRAVYIPSGIGHAFMALEDNSTFVYLCDQRYNPNNEFEINPMDKAIGITWPDGITPILSDKDKAAPGLDSIIE